MIVLPLRAKNPPESIPVATCLLILINIAVFATTLDGLHISRQVVNDWGIRPSNVDIPHLISSMFLHGSIMHLVGNMWFLYILGFAVEGRLGTLRFVILYLIAGITGDFLQIAFEVVNGSNLPGIGASGAIMGVMGAAIYLFPYSKVTIFYQWWWRFGTTDWPMWGIGLFFVGFDLFNGLISAGFGSGGGGVGHFAHLGGVLGGFLVALAMRGRRDNEAMSEAKATLHDMKNLSMLAPKELRALAQSNPEDTTVTLNWVHRTLRDPQGVPLDCVAAFQRQLPKMIREEPIGSVATAMAALAMTPGRIHTRFMMDAAMRVEMLPDPNLAYRLYSIVLNDPNTPPQDREAALFRMGLLYETQFKQPNDAVAFYRQVAEQFPMGTFADQARIRMRGMGVPA